ncbi:MAG: cytochrome c biogenesis protein CcsA [Eggerthellaceae bacterium]|nr:cytochrome c biogenesis protein CcsA [Eggerthellaceae bacterium]
MSVYGLIGLLVAFAGVAISLCCFALSHLVAKQRAHRDFADTLAWSGHIATILTTVALTFCCGLLVFCFMAGDMSIQYVVQNQSKSSSELAWLFKLSGLWGGREGSLLFWAWLISLFNTFVAIRNMKALEKLDNAALFMAQLVLAAFIGVLLFSESNMPFTAMAAEHFNSAGELTGVAALWGMNVLLEHWAMSVHPPTLFIGYAGMTIPFAYAVAALIVRDPSKAWVAKCSRITVFSWLFLGIGIGLGAVWAYVVLGWGGYWGWDPVENASLLPWLVGVGLIHSFTVYRNRGAFKRWSVMCACLAFAFVILGTFITRSGLVQSVHAFDGDPVSLALFLGLILASILIGIVGLVVRWKDFGADTAGGDDFDSMVSKDAAYYFNNLVMVVAAILLAYLTVSSALPAWLPFGGQTMSAGTYNAIARPLGILYLGILAVCPLLSWGKTEGKRFWKRVRIPGICALVLFAVLMAYLVTCLVPSYNAVIATGGPNAEGLLEEGPFWYYHGLAAVGFFVASLLFFNALFMLGRKTQRYAKKQGTNVFAAALGMLKNRASTYGGFISHLAMSLILVGLIGSSMYVSERADVMTYMEETDTAANDFHFKDYTLKYKDNDIDVRNDGDEIFYKVRFDVYRNGEYTATVAPTIQVVTATMQQRLIADVVSFPTEDLFVVYRGVNDMGAFSLDVKINRLISFVWIGFGLLMLGVAVATFGGRKGPRATREAAERDTVAAGGDAAAGRKRHVGA